MIKPTFNKQKKILYFLIFGFVLIRGQLVDEPFTYSDGNLVGNGNWVNFSGTSGQIQVSSGIITLTDASSEDARVTFTAQNSGMIYYGFDIIVSDPGSYSGTDFEYFCGFADNTTFENRVDIAAFSASGWKPGISNSSPTAEAIWAINLDYATTYRILVGLNIGTGVSDLWVNPSSISSTKITGTGSQNVNEIDAFFLRQSNGTPNITLTMDNLVVSTDFDESLPVELTSFIATPQKGAIELSWVTESEIDNLGFLIDRSLEPNSGFTTIADYRFVPELQGQGSVTYRTDYSYTDREVVPGTRYYYVLSDVTGNPEHGEPVNRHTDKMVSATPKSQDISSALINGFKTFKAYPNPFNPKTVIAYELEEIRELSVSIVDVHGRQVTELYSGLQAQGFHEFTWQPKDISAGIYFCHLTSGGNTITRKLVLLK